MARMEMYLGKPTQLQYTWIPVSSPVSMVQVAVVAVLVVPVSCVSQGGFEQSLWTTPVAVLVWSPPMLEVAVDGVLVVPVSCVSQGGLEQTLCTVPVGPELMLDDA